MKYSYLPRGYTQVLNKMQFFLIEAMELRKFVFRRKDLTLTYICDIILKKSIYHEKLHIKNENLLFSKFQHNIQENCVVLGKTEDDIVLWTPFHSRIC